MRNKGKLLALVMLLVLMLAVAVSAGAADYTVIRPDGYSADFNYPVVYVMPEDGYAKHNGSNIAEKLADANTMDMLVVEVEFAAGENIYDAMDAVIQNVDANYNTIADADYRAVVGTGVGGYMAYVLGLSDDKAAVSSPVRFGSIASIRGDFASSANPWVSTYGAAIDYLSAISARNFQNFYIYLDAPVDDAWTNMDGSTNDMGYVMIGHGNTPVYQEFTCRPGSFNGAFVTESVNRVADRLATKMLSGLATATVSLGTTVIPESANVDINYTVTLDDALAVFSDNSELAVDIVVSVIDPITGNVLYKAAIQDDVKVAPGSTVTKSTESKNANKVNGDSSNVVVSLRLLGGEVELATTTLMRAADPIIQGDYQVLSLMGDWKFNFTRYTKLDPTTFTPDTYANWSVVQPGLGNWVYGYGNINEETVGRPNSTWFNYMIYNNGYYAKDFFVPANFDAEDLVFVVGYMDDRGEVWLNGQRIGGTGMTEDGTPTGDTTWAVFSYYDIPANLLKRGETNTVVVRNYNDGMGGGGWYKGPVGVYSQEAFDTLFGTGETERFYESSFYSEAVGADVQYLVSLPESYFETERYYPTVYLMHQINSDHTSYRGDAVNEILDAGAKAGIFDEMIVVIPNSTESSWWSGKWEDMVIDDLIPYIDENFRTIKDSRYRMTAGCSMGGYGSMAIGLRNPDYFSGVISFFGAISMGTSSNRPISVAQNTSAEYMDYFSIYLTCGNQDTYKFGQPAIRLNQKLEEMGVNHFYFIENGEHNSAFYVPFFDDAFEYLRNDMYDAGDIDIDSLIFANASIDKENEIVYLNVAADEKIKKYFNTIPASIYTKDSTPALNAPITVTLRDKTTKAIYRYTVRDNNFEPFTGSFGFNSFKIDLNDFVLVEDSVTPDITTESSAATFAFDGEVDPANLEIVNIKGSLFDDRKTASKTEDEITPLKSIPEEWRLPATGDDSNVMLFAALLLISVAGIAVMSKKKAAC